jgi:hypothetical protein
MNLPIMASSRKYIEEISERGHCRRVSEPRAVLDVFRKAASAVQENSLHD